MRCINEMQWGRLCSACRCGRVLVRVVVENESQGVKAYAYLEDTTITSHEISLGAVGVVPLPERTLTTIAEYT